MEKKKFYVRYTVTGTFIAEVEAKTLEEAQELADEKLDDATFEPLDDIDAEMKLVEDSVGNELWTYEG